MCYRHSFHDKWAHHHPRFKKHGPRRRKGAWSKWPGFSGMWGHPPANVLEYDDRFELFLFAPGLEKTDFEIKVTDNLLSISVQKNASDPEENFNWRRKEFHTSGFTRKFELNNKIDSKSITATYEAGILKLSFPKLEEYFTERQDIQIA